MAERPSAKPEIASQKRVIKLPPAIGDWTAYRPPKILVKKVKTGLYGFDRLSKDDLNRLLRIHYQFIQALLLRLKVDLGMGVEFLSCQVEQTTYLNFLRTLTGAVAQGKITVSNIHESIQLYFDLGLANSVINHALGSHDLEILNRGLTEAEKTVFTTSFSEYLAYYNQAFENVLEDLSFSLVSSPDVALDPSINTSATFVSFSAEISLNDNPSGKIIFGYPGSSVKILLKAFEEKDRAKPLNFSRLTPAALNKIAIPVSALLGKTTLFTSELKQLETGDVVSLDSLTSSAVTLTVGNILKILAQPGIKNKKKAARIAGFREGEEVEIIPPIVVPAPAPTPPAEPMKEEEEKEEEFKEEDLFPEEEEALLEEEFPEEELEEELGEEEEK